MAFRGIDLRDLYRRGTGLTLRRLLVLIRAIPEDDPLKLELRAAEAAERKPKPDQIRDRQAAFEARNRRQAEAGVSDD